MSFKHLKSAIDKINQHPVKAYFAATGGGTSFGGEFLRIPGASGTILGGRIPYHQDDFVDFAGKPDKFASQQAARLLAGASYAKALKITGDKSISVGIGAACSICAGENEREGREHRIFVATQTSHTTRVFEQTYLNNGREISENRESVRDYEEGHTSQVMLWMLAQICGVKIDELWSPDEVYCKSFIADDGMQRLYNGISSFYDPQLTLVDGNETGEMLLYPGSFNPVHRDHEEAAKVAEEITGRECVFEVSITNADKPKLDYYDISLRREAFKDQGKKFLFTDAMLFSDKITRLTNFGIKPIFVVGSDTWERIIDPKYYGGNRGLLGFLRDAVVKGAKFIVMRRNGKDYRDYIPVQIQSGINEECSLLVIDDIRAHSFDSQNLSSRDLRNG